MPPPKKSGFLSDQKETHKVQKYRPMEEEKGGEIQTDAQAYRDWMADDICLSSPKKFRPLEQNETYRKQEYIEEEKGE